MQSLTLWAAGNGRYVGKGLLRLGHLVIRTLEMHFYPDRRDFEDIVDVLDVSFHLSPVERLRRRISLPASSVARVPIIHPAVAAII